MTQEGGSPLMRTMPLAGKCIGGEPPSCVMNWTNCMEKMSKLAAVLIMDFMRKTLFISAFLILAASFASSAQMRYSNVQSNSSISAQILGLEYGYEWAIGGNWSLIGRAGISPSGMELYSYSDSFEAYFAAAAAVTVEPRYYTSMNRRLALGRDTYLNSADFVSLPAQMIFDEEGGALVLTPMYGIRRATGYHWIHEVTFGTRLYCGEYCTLMPHLQYRIGFVF